MTAGSIRDRYATISGRGLDWDSVPMRLFQKAKRLGPWDPQALDFMVHPVVLGKGKRLLAESPGQTVLDLTETKRFASGIVILELEPGKKS